MRPNNNNNARMDMGRKFASREGLSDAHKSSVAARTTLRINTVKKR